MRIFNTLTSFSKLNLLYNRRRNIKRSHVRDRYVEEVVINTHIRSDLIKIIQNILFYKTGAVYDVFLPEQKLSVLKVKLKLKHVQNTCTRASVRLILSANCSLRVQSG